MVEDNAGQTHDTPAEGQDNPTPSNDGNDAPSAEPNMLQRSEAVADRIEKANEEAKKIAERMEKAASANMLGGRSQAGQVQKTQEEINEEKMDADVKSLTDDYK